jgi:hypothetical protein
MLCDKARFSRAFLDVSLPPRIDQPWYTLRMEREWQEDELEDNMPWHSYFPREVMFE